jgi:hypothetical protein
MESDISIEGAVQFSVAAEAAADIIRRGVEALQRLAAQEIGAPIVDGIVAGLVQRSPKAVPLPHTRHAMRARKMGRVLRFIAL